MGSLQKMGLRHRITGDAGSKKWRAAGLIDDKKGL
jgi:hypothetical protein